MRTPTRTQVRLENAVMFVKAKSVPIRGAGIRIGEEELSFLVDKDIADWFVQEINSLMDSSVSGAGPAVGELMWTNHAGEYTNVRKNNNVNWRTVSIERNSHSLRVLAPGDDAAGTPPTGDDPRFSRISVRPLATGDKLTVHTIDGGSM